MGSLRRNPGSLGDENGSSSRKVSHNFEETMPYQQTMDLKKSQINEEEEHFEDSKFNSVSQEPLRKKFTIKQSISSKNKDLRTIQFGERKPSYSKKSIQNR